MDVFLRKETGKIVMYNYRMPWKFISDVLNFIARLNDDKGVISLCGLPDNDYLHFGCNLKEASRPKNGYALLLKINRLSVRIIKPYQIILVGFCVNIYFEYFATVKLHCTYNRQELTGGTNERIH